MSCSKSQKEDAGPTPPPPFLNTRTALKLGTWNVRTMFDTGRTVQVARERGLGMGQMKLATGKQLIYSGHTDSTDIDTHWKHSKELWIGTCEEVLGERE